MTNFDDMNISSGVKESLKEAGFESPTPIQSSVIPFFLENDQDIIALAGTGTGKTAAFGIPLLEKLDYRLPAVQAVILSPVRELAMQINDELEMLSSKKHRPEILSIYGGTKIGAQIRRMQNGVQILCATPGRLRDILEKKCVDFSNVNYFVIDEADRFFEMGFLEDLEFIMMNMPKEKQVCMFSATMPPAVQKLAQNFIREPEMFKVKGTNESGVNISHSYVAAGRGHKYEVLRRLLDHSPDIYGIVFCRTKRDTAEISEKLHRDGYEIDCLHGDMQQMDRESVIRKFKSKKLKLLAATDVAARGIDVDSLTHIINYSLPDDPETYIHRTGRTARAGKSGKAISIIEKSDFRRISFFERKIKTKINRMNIPSGEDICRKQLNFISDSFNASDFDIEAFKDEFPEVYAKFNQMSRDDMLIYILSSEYGKIHEFYNDRKDLKEVQLGGNTGRNACRGNRERYDRRDGNRRNGRETFDRRDGNRRNGRESFDRRSGGRSGGGDFSRFFITLGRKDQISPKDIIGFINQSTQIRNINIGDIDIKDNFSFFEADASYTDVILRKCDNSKFKNKRVSVEQAKAKK